MVSFTKLKFYFYDFNLKIFYSESMERNDGVVIPRHGNRNSINIAKSAPMQIVGQISSRGDSDLEDVSLE